ncbi:MAG: potassium transporter Kup [Thermoanaerobaculia bacterium]
MRGHKRGRGYFVGLSVTALGVVYGDIGTSPLYAVRECFNGPHAAELTRANILGVLSLIFWALMIVITLKYVTLVMRADNKGEGGTLALAALTSPPGGKPDSRRYWVLTVIALFGAALFFGDGMITPAISVLSAVEGLNVATPVFTPFVVPITIVILLGLFLAQKRGTGKIGAIFGPVMLGWFSVLAILGLSQIVRAPEVLLAVNPLHAIDFFRHQGAEGFLVLGAVFLCVTGGEALYADMGHFGKMPIRLTWFSVAMPGLLLNYFGQGALLLREPGAVDNPFYRMGPSWALYPMVILATAATVIASQAVISGAFSLARQAVLLGYSPRLDIDHTSDREIGQIYIPLVNWILMIACIVLVLGFRTSSNLAAAYGIAVTGDMVVTAILLWVVMMQRWRWSVALATVVVLPFLLIDLAFFAANAVKIAAGGWVPLVVGFVVFSLMATWKRGRQILDDRLRSGSLPLDLFLTSVMSNPPHRVPGTAVFMHRNAEGVPTALLHSLKHYKVLHETIVLLSVQIEEEPYVDPAMRLEIENSGSGVWSVVVHFGFMDDTDIPKALSEVRVEGLDLDPAKTSYFLGRETLVATHRHAMASWREKLFIWMSRNASGAGLFFRLPPNRIVELGAQIEV